MDATNQQIVEQSQAISRLADAIANDTIVGPKYAAIKRLADMVDTLAAWVGDDR